jgi:hypothetical protein
MVRKAQKSQGADVLMGTAIISIRTSTPCDLWAFPTMKRELRGARNFQVINGLQHVFDKWVERCKKCIAFQGRYFEKETVTTPPQSSDSE